MTVLCIAIWIALVLVGIIMISDKFGLYISNEFGSGKSSNSITFKNDPLSVIPEFSIKLFEVWGVVQSLN